MRLAEQGFDHVLTSMTYWLCGAVWDDIHGLEIDF